MTDRGFHELKCDANKLMVKLSSAVDAERYGVALTLMGRLQEMAQRLDAEQRQRKTLEWARTNATGSGQSHY